MASVKDFYEYLNFIAPFDTQEDWDNSGLLAGDPDAEVKKAAVVLDITVEAIRQAHTLGADLIISHHPLIFEPLKSVVKGTPAYELISRGMNAICCHTPLDIAQGGTNDTLAKLLGFEVHAGDDPILRFGTISETDTKNLAQHIGKALNTTVRYADAGKPVKKIAICTGSGCSLLSQAGDIDAFITGDASHHNFLDALQEGISVIAAGHYETEVLVVPVLKEKLAEHFKDTEIIEIKQDNPVNFC